MHTGVSAAFVCLIEKSDNIFPVSQAARRGRLGWLVVVGGPVMIHADGGVMFSLADVVINMPSPPYEDNDRDDDIDALMKT